MELDSELPYNIPFVTALHNLRPSRQHLSCKTKATLLSATSMAGSAVLSQGSSLIREGFDQRQEADGKRNQRLGGNSNYICSHRLYNLTSVFFFFFLVKNTIFKVISDFLSHSAKTI